MPRRAAAGCEPVFVEIPIEMKAKLVALAERNQRGLKQELLHALERHLSAPPMVVVQTPTLPPAQVEVQPADQPRPKLRGRPPKQKPA